MLCGTELEARSLWWVEENTSNWSRCLVEEERAFVVHFPMWTDILIWDVGVYLTYLLYGKCSNVIDVRA
jgi:hypothetical protein